MRATADTKMTTKWARMCPLLAGLILGITPDLGAEETPTVVTLAGKPVPDARLRDALLQCKDNAPDLNPSTCLDRYWVPRWLLDEQASADKLHESEALVEVRRKVLSTRLLEKVSEQAERPSAKEVESYLREHQREFSKPLRVRIFRILVSTEEKAKELLASLDETTTLADFRALSREHSIDQATNERGGDLGFVWPDGSTDIPQVSANKSLYEAASSLEDGQFAGVPIPEGKHFAVLWRRGSLPAESMGEHSTRLARLRLEEKKAHEAVESLLSKLSKNVTRRDDELLGKLRRPEATLFREP